MILNSLIILNSEQDRDVMRTALCGSFKVKKKRFKGLKPPEGFDTVLLDFLRAGLTWEIIKSEPVGREPLQARRQAVRRPETSQGSRPATRQRLWWRGEAARRWEVHGNGNLRTLSVLAPSLKSNSLPHMESHTSRTETNGDVHTWIKSHIFSHVWLQRLEARGLDTAEGLSVDKL